MKKTLLSLVAILAFAGFANAQVPARTGWWKFDDAADMLKAEIGLPLELTGTQTSVDGPAAGNLAVEVPLGSYLTMTHGIAPNGGGTMVNEYTLQLDFLMPVGALWHSMYQSDPANSDDGELFINESNNIGASRHGYSANVVADNTWYRLLVSVKNGTGGFFKLYMDGQLWVDGAARDIDTREALADVLLLFADESAEDNTMLCSEVCIWDVALSADDALLLGDATTVQTGIKENRAAKASDLMPNYPNPVAHNTIFPYQVQKTGNVTFRILDQTGKVIDVINAGAKTPGKYNFNYNSDKLNNGIYTVQMTTNNRTSVRKMVVLQ